MYQISFMLTITKTSVSFDSLYTGIFPQHYSIGAHGTANDIA